MTEAAERDAADATWRTLTRAQRELLLSTAAGAPIEGELDDEDVVLDAGLIALDTTLNLIVTHAGRMLIQRRSTP